MMERGRDPAQITSRPASPADGPAVLHLLRNAPRLMLRTRWWQTYLGDDSFYLTLAGDRLVGALLAYADIGPVAWTQLGALAAGMGVNAWLSASLPGVVQTLRKRGARLLLWMDAERWASDALRKQGFRPVSSIIMLGLERSEMQPVIIPGVMVRDGLIEDVPDLVRLDRAAFTPPWWLGEESLHRLRQHSTCFLVAERAGRCIGYAEGNIAEQRAHIGRLAVEPQAQGQGIGGLLLQGALERLWAMGAGLVTLNTQEDNLRSQRLYRRFGFRRLGAEIEVLGRYL